MKRRYFPRLSKKDLLIAAIALAFVALSVPRLPAESQSSFVALYHRIAGR